jgi:hypothetical protein
MGLDNSSIMLLCAAKSMNVNFESTATIGRQGFWPDHEVLQRVFALQGIDRDAEAFLEQHPYGEEFLHVLGAKQVDSVDVSSYENATILHDMNLPIPSDLKERFTLVHDGGSLEHVFNVPQAFKNCMEMVRVGGHFTQVTVANNFAGHGFWQFSPELIFRLFSAQNGFQLQAVLMHENIPGGAWYVVTDPDQVQRRVELRNSESTYIMTIAKRIARVPIFEKTPQQSDYVAMWGTKPGQLSATPGSSWKRRIPKPLKRALKSMLHYLQPFEAPGIEGFNRPGYRRVAEKELLRGRIPFE